MHNHLAKFVRADRDLLAERYTVQEWYQRGRAVNLLALGRAVRECDLVFGWFASWHTLFPVLMAQAQGKPSVLAAGGYDVANMPEIGYGSMRGGFKRWTARTALGRASRALPFSEAARAETLKAGVPPERVTTCYLGVPAAPPLAVAKEKLVITVGNVDRDNVQRKGLEPFVRAAALMPEVRFAVIGAWRDEAVDDLKRFAPANVEFTGWVDEASLRDMMGRAKVYVQASRHEGFGLAAAEAMLQQCIPVVTRAGSLPEVAGDEGVYAESNEPAEVARAVLTALTLDASWGQRARERILREFPVERRREKLFALIDELTGRE